MSNKEIDNSQKPLSVIPSRLTLLREEKNWSQTQLAEHLTEAVADLGKTISVSSVSFWETGGRAVPQKYIYRLANLLDSSVEYLCGLSNDVYGTNETSNSKMDIHAIPYTHLYKFDKKPIFVEFNNYEHEPNWGIYDKSRNRIVFADYILNINPVKNGGITFYTNSACYYPVASGEEKNKRPINMADVMASDMVYINMKTSDKFIQGKYNGWYQHNEDYSALINNRGLILPYEGLNISYNAYSMTEY